MGLHVQESFASASSSVTCHWCKRKVKFHDVISDGSVACLSCSYEKGFTPGEDCIVNPRQFDPSDTELRDEMLRCARVDIERADPRISSVTILIPEDLFGPIKTVRKTHGATLNELIVSALGWYTAMCQKRAAEVSVGIATADSLVTDPVPLLVGESTSDIER